MDSKSKVPQPVEVTNPEPLPVVETSTEPRDVNVVSDETSDTRAQTTARATAALARVDAEVLRTEDQRRISGMWERTQQIIALSVVEVTLFVVSVIVMAPGIATIFDFPVDDQAQGAASTGIVFLASVANLVIGFYFGRTNHQRIGGSATVEEANRGR